MLVVITGGLSGIGQALAEHYYGQGATVAIVDIAPSVQSYYYPCDISDAQAVDKTAAIIHHELGSPDLVINCAGVLRAGPFSALTSADFNLSYQVNVLGTRNIAAAFLPLMKSGSQFAMVASMAGTVGIYGYSAYGSSKFAVLGFAQCLRCEYAPKGIGISVICPPEIDTPMVVEETKSMHPATRLLKDFAGRLTLAEAIPAMVTALAKRRFMIIPGKLAKLTFWLNRLTPIWLHNQVVDWLVKRKI